MNELNKIIKAHFILGNTLLVEKQIHHAPRVGDELRFHNNNFFIVEHLVWVYDEGDQPMSRLNIGIVKVDK